MATGYKAAECISNVQIETLMSNQYTGCNLRYPCNVVSGTQDVGNVLEFWLLKLEFGNARSPRGRQREYWIEYYITDSNYDIQLMTEQVVVVVPLSSLYENTLEG